MCYVSIKYLHIKSTYSQFFAIAHRLSILFRVAGADSALSLNCIWYGAPPGCSRCIANAVSSLIMDNKVMHQHEKFQIMLLDLDVEFGHEDQPRYKVIDISIMRSSLALHSMSVRLPSTNDSRDSKVTRWHYCSITPHDVELEAMRACFCQKKNHCSKCFPNILKSWIVDIENFRKTC